MAQNERVAIDLEAKDNASKTIDKVADKVEDLERKPAEVDVTADTSQAERSLSDVRDDVERLAREDAELVLRAKVDAARLELKSLQTELKQTGDVAETTGRRLDDATDKPGTGVRANAIADLTGPLGDASSQAGEFGEVFEGLDEIVGGVFSRMGASAATLGAVSSAMGGLGLVVAGAAAAFAIFRGNQQKAEQRQKELTEAVKDFNDALREGDREAQARTVQDLFKDEFEAAEAAGIATRDLARYLIGLSDELPGTALKVAQLNEEVRLQQERMKELGLLPGAEEEAVRVRDAYVGLLDTLADGRTEWAETEGSVAHTDEQLRQISEAFGDAQRATDDAADAQKRIKDALERTDDKLQDLRDHLSMEHALQSFSDAVYNAMTGAEGEVTTTADEVLALKDSILTLGETAKTNPAVIESQLNAVTADNIWDVAKDVSQYYAKNPVGVATKLLPPGQTPSNPFVNVPKMAPLPPAVPVPTPITVHQYIPRGYRGDVLADARQAARRSGGLYRRHRR
jgi:chromosome segregation ATPase